MSEDLQSQRYYVLERISELREQIPQAMQAMVVFRARIEKYRQTDLSAAHDTYDALRRIRDDLTQALADAQPLLMELESYALAAMAGQLLRGFKGFDLMSTGYRSVYDAVCRFAQHLPEKNTVNAATIGRLMNNVKLGYYPTAPDNIALMLQGISFPEGVTTNVFDPCCGCGKALRQIAQGNNCYAYGVELDESRAEEAQTRLHRVGFGSFFHSDISREAFHLLFLNPPYLSVLNESGSKARHEKRFLIESIPHLLYGGLLLYVIPYYGQLKPGYQCPTCRRAVTADELPAMQNAFRTSIKQIVEEGQAERAKLEELQALEKKARDTFLQFQKDDIAKLEETLQEAKEAAEPDATRPEAQQLQERMQALAAELEFGALSQEEYDRMFACREELQQVRADIAAIEKATPASGDLDSQMKAARAEIDQCKLKLQYLAQYISKRAEMTFSALKMNRVEISLYDVVKSTGEVKDAFKFTYNGRRYDWLSLSEKIRAGMEVSELMKRLTGRNYPQFVDNMESVDDLANVRPTGQVIMAKCVSKAELSVRPVKPILTAMPTAA